jgi:DNA-binding CsgD family transcriptional regulator
VSERSAHDYVHHYHKVDPMGRSIAEAKGVVVCLSDYVRDSRLSDLEFYELLKDVGTRRIAGITKRHGRTGALAIALHRGGRQHDFSPKERFVVELVAQAFIRLLQEEAPRDEALDQLGLTERQRRVVLLAAHGLGDREVARELGIEVSTVRTHLKRLYSKLGVQNRTELARIILTAGRR